jgi:hypothetical protein
MSYQRISPISAPGSLFKSATPSRKRKSGRQGEVKRDANYLALIRRCPCLSCDCDPAGVAAHVRMTRVGKPITGTGIKPGDQWTLPLCDVCHTNGPQAQHVVGELKFWSDLGLDPLVICQRLYSASPDIEVMRQVCFDARNGRT